MDDYICTLITKPKYKEFAVLELISLAQMYGVDYHDLLSFYNLDRCMTQSEVSEYFIEHSIKYPLIHVRFPNDSIPIEILSRAVCVRSFMRLLSEGNSLEEIHADLIHRIPTEPRLSAIIQEDSGFSFEVESVRKKIAKEDSIQMIEGFQVVPFKGSVNLTSPKRRFMVSECEGRYYFGIDIYYGVRTKTRFYSKYSLKERLYLGPTSTDTELAFLMANQAQIQPGMTAFDPFVGTGSILIAAAHFGAICYGSDIDIRVLKGYGVGHSKTVKNPNIFTNFHSYNLPLPEIIRADNAKPLLRPAPFFDAIICDPPYGVRAASRKVNSKKFTVIASTSQYAGQLVVADLLNLAANSLRIGGRLVFLLPIFREEYNKSQLPSHPLLRLIGNSENVLSWRVSRRLITMEKIAEPEGSHNEGSFYSSLRDKWHRKA